MHKTVALFLYFTSQCVWEGGGEKLLLVCPVFLVLSFHHPYVPSSSAGGVVILTRNIYQGLTMGTGQLCKMEGQFPVLKELRPGISAVFQDDRKGADG